jgi:hypothetical protein
MVSSVDKGRQRVRDYCEVSSSSHFFHLSSRSRCQSRHGSRQLSTGAVSLYNGRYLGHRSLRSPLTRLKIICTATLSTPVYLYYPIIRKERSSTTPTGHAVHTLQYRIIFPDAEAAGRARRADRAYAGFCRQVESCRRKASRTSDGELHL